MPRRLREALAAKLRGPERAVREVAAALPSAPAPDAEAYVARGLEAVEEVVLAQPFTRHGWLLAAYRSAGLVEGRRVVVYYNRSEPRWTASYAVHELAHVGLGLERRSAADVVADEALAYLASFKLGFLGLYEEGLAGYARLASECALPEGYELAHTVLPRLLAKGLVGCDYGLAARAASRGLRELVGLWLGAGPPPEERRALAAGLAALGEDPLAYGLGEPCRAPGGGAGAPAAGARLEGVDEGFLGMLEALERAAACPGGPREALAPWWGEVEPVLDAVEAYVEVARASREADIYRRAR